MQGDGVGFIAKVCGRFMDVYIIKKIQKKIK